VCGCHPCGVPKVPYRVWYQYRFHSNITASQSICQTAASLAISVGESEPDPEGFGAFAAGDRSLTWFTTAQEVVALQIMRANYEQLVKAHQRAPQVPEDLVPDETKFQVERKALIVFLLWFRPRG
jgi:hypothetical protein